MSQRISDEPAFLLHSRVYGETSEIGEFFTRNHGKLPAIMRARRGSKKNPRLLQGRLYNIALVGSGEILQLTSAEMQDATQLDATGAKLLSVLYVCELLHALLQRGDASPELFDAFALWQNQLHSAQHVMGLRRFEVLLLDALGYGLDTRTDTDGEPICADVRYWVNPNRGYFRSASANEPGIMGAALIAFNDPQTSCTDASVLNPLRQLTRFLLEFRLAGKTIRSWQLGASLSALKSQLNHEPIA
jgi:DNA repair protein RecO (recombination protein O)